MITKVNAIYSFLFMKREHDSWVRCVEALFVKDTYKNLQSRGRPSRGVQGQGTNRIHR